METSWLCALNGQHYHSVDLRVENVRWAGLASLYIGAAGLYLGGVRFRMCGA